MQRSDTVEENEMTKGKHGNKEAKKPKKVPAPPAAPAGTTPGALAVASLRRNKKW
jgi:hypothetical protein